MMKNILLFGSTGLIGKSVNKTLCKGDNNIITFGRKKADYIIDLENFEPISIKQETKVLIYCAGVTDEEIINNKNQAIKKNTVELVKLVEWAKKIGVEHFIYISSAHVYGDLNKELTPESKVAPKSLYSTLHLFAENYINSKFNKSTIIRPGAVYGEVSKKFNRWELIPFSFPRDLALNNKIIIKSHGMQERNFISSSTISKIIAHSIEKSIFGIINPVGHYSISILDFANLCIKTIDERKSNNLNLKLEVLEKSSYVSKFNFMPNPNIELPKEDKNLLKEHIYKMYKQIYESK